MKKKLWLLIFVVLSTIALTIGRTVIVGNYIDPFNGFFNPKFSHIRMIFAVALIAFVALVALFCIKDKGYPVSPRRSSITLGIINLVYAICSIIEVFINLKAERDVYNIIYIGVVSAIAVFMLYYAFCMFTLKYVSPILGIVPLLAFVYKLGYVFVSSFGIIKTSEVTLSIVALVFVVLFFEFYAGYIGKARIKKVRKPMLISGCCAVAFITVSTVPNLIVSVFYPDVTPRIATDDTMFLIATACYIALFLVVSFAKRAVYSNPEISGHVSSNNEVEY